MMKYCLLLFALLCCEAGGSTVETPASTVLDLGWTFQRFAGSNDGRIPETWADVEPLLRRGTYLEVLGAPPEVRLHFLGEAGPQHPRLGRVLVVSKGPIQEDRHDSLGRYVLSLLPDGSFSRKWLDEAEARKLFEDAGQKLPEGPLWVQPPVKNLESGSKAPPPPDRLPPAEPSASRDPVPGWWLVAGLLAVGAAAGVIIWLRRMRGRRLS